MKKQQKTPKACSLVPLQKIIWQLITIYKMAQPMLIGIRSRETSMEIITYRAKTSIVQR